MIRDGSKLQSETTTVWKELEQTPFDGWSHLLHLDAPQRLKCFINK